MKTKTIRQTVTFNAAPLEVYEMLMDSKKHKSLSGEEAKISRKWAALLRRGDHTSAASIWCLSRERGSCRPGARRGGGRITIQ